MTSHSQPSAPPLPFYFEAIVTDIQEYSRVSGQTIWRMALNHTAFSPVRGMYACSTGRWIATSRSGAQLSVEILHVEADAAGQIWHHTRKPLQAGTAIRGEVDPPATSSVSMP